MRIDIDGNVGIGSTAPTVKLDVVGAIKSTGNLTAGGNLSVTGTGSVGGTMSVTGNLTASADLLMPNISAGSGVPLAYDSATNRFVKATSSLRYKNNVANLSTVVDSEKVIADLRPTVFEYKTQPGQKVYGFIAEETEGIDRNLVEYKDGIVDAVHFFYMSPLLINEVKRIPALLARIEELERKVGNN
jgi:hypothetical protein